MPGFKMRYRDESFVEVVPSVQEEEERTESDLWEAVGATSRIQPTESGTVSGLWEVSGTRLIPIVTQVNDDLIWEESGATRLVPAE